LISNIYNTFDFANEIIVDGAGDPGEVANRVAMTIRDVFEGAVAASTKTAKVNFAG
jgi:hypothetical protein